MPQSLVLGKSTHWNGILLMGVWSLESADCLTIVFFTSIREKKERALPRRSRLYPFFCHFNKAKPGYMGSMLGIHSTVSRTGRHSLISAKSDNSHVIKGLFYALVDCNLQIVMQSCRCHWQLDITALYMYIFILIVNAALSCCQWWSLQPCDSSIFTSSMCRFALRNSVCTKESRGVKPNLQTYNFILCMYNIGVETSYRYRFKFTLQV